mmetsp:Transcript_11988/g.38146  ORF Transcript_11988/g.38146 Transcript_11988/m.38146 type:complete len:423 (-) Transcript_11988:148-1416(-)
MMRVAQIATATAWISALESGLAWECPHGRPLAQSSEWMASARAAKTATEFRSPDRVTVDLDLPPEERWVAVGEQYRNQSSLIVEYFEQYLPASVISLLVELFEPIDEYPGFGDYGLEMRGYATGLNLSLGYVVMANLAYQLEEIGVGCANWNTTGPTGQCETYARTKSDPRGFCTSVVADDAENRIYHARNLDWNLGDDLRAAIFTVDFTRNGSLFYSGTTVLSFVGILNGMRPGMYSYSFDARCQGGHLLVNLAEALATGAATPSQHARAVFESEPADFDAFVDAFSEGQLIDDAYYILGGLSDQEGAVVTRARNRAVDVWPLNESVWYRLETNYDHWETPPTADDRRTPGVAHMDNLTQAGVTTENLFTQLLWLWPTFNDHTDISCVMAPWNSTYDCRVILPTTTTGKAVDPSLLATAAA